MPMAASPGIRTNRCRAWVAAAVASPAAAAPSSSGPAAKLPDQRKARASPGSTAGITSYYNTGYGGLGVLGTSSGVTPDAYFDDVKYGTPEPATIALMAAGIGALILRRRRA